MTETEFGFYDRPKETYEQEMVANNSGQIPILVLKADAMFTGTQDISNATIFASTSSFLETRNIDYETGTRDFGHGPEPYFCSMGDYGKEAGSGLIVTLNDEYINLSAARVLWRSGVDEIVWYYKPPPKDV